MESKKVVESKEKPTIRDPFLMKKIHEKSIKISINFLNQVRQTLQDDKKYSTFLDTLTDFQQHNDVVRFTKEAFPLLTNHPQLYLQLQWFVSDRTDPNSENAISSISDRESPNQYNQAILQREEELFSIDALYYTLTTAKAAAERLVRENTAAAEKLSGAAEEIDVAEYYSCLNLEYLGNLYEGEYLSSRLMRREKAIEESIAIGGELEKEIRKVKIYRKLAEERLEEAVVVDQSGKGKGKAIY